MRGDYCTCSCSLSSTNDEKMISCARVYWICHFISWISHPRPCFIAFKMKFNYPVPSHFQFSGRDGSGTGIPSDPAPRQFASLGPQDCHRRSIFQYIPPLSSALLRYISSPRTILINLVTVDEKRSGVYAVVL